MSDEVYIYFSLGSIVLALLGITLFFMCEFKNKSFKLGILMGSFFPLSFVVGNGSNFINTLLIQVVMLGLTYYVEKLVLTRKN